MDPLFALVIIGHSKPEPKEHQINPFFLFHFRHELNSHQAKFDIRTLQGHGDDEYTVTRDEMLKVEASYNQMSAEKEELHTDYIELQAKLEELLAENERLQKELETQKKTNQLKTAKYEAQVQSLETW